MDWGLISGCTSLIGLIISLVRIGDVQENYREEKNAEPTPVD